MSHMRKDLVERADSIPSKCTTLDTTYRVILIPRFVFNLQCSSVSILSIFSIDYASLIIMNTALVSSLFVSRSPCAQIGSARCSRPPHCASRRRPGMRTRIRRPYAIYIRVLVLTHSTLLYSRIRYTRARVSDPLLFLYTFRIRYTRTEYIVYRTRIIVSVTGTRTIGSPLVSPRLLPIVPRAQIYRCPFLTSFCIEIETRYMDDAGAQDNLFGLSARELKERVVGAPAPVPPLRLRPLATCTLRLVLFLLLVLLLLRVLMLLLLRALLSSLIRPLSPLPTLTHPLSFALNFHIERRCGRFIFQYGPSEIALAEVHFIMIYGSISFQKA